VFSLPDANIHPSSERVLADYMSLGLAIARALLEVSAGSDSRLMVRHASGGRMSVFVAQVGEHREHAAVKAGVDWEVEFGEHVADVGLDGFGGQPQSLGDAAVGEPLGDQREDL